MGTTNYISRPPSHRQVMPLESFPPEHMERIIAQALADYPPPKYRVIHDDRGRPMVKMSSRAWYEWHWCRGIDPDRKRRSLSPAQRQRVIDRDGLVCGLCGTAVEPDDIDIDHIIPVSRGGTDHFSNLQVTHSTCNRKKGNRHVVDQD